MALCCVAAPPLRLACVAAASLCFEYKPAVAIVPTTRLLHSQLPFPDLRSPPWCSLSLPCPLPLLPYFAVPALDVLGLGKQPAMVVGRDLIGSTRVVASLSRGVMWVQP